MEIGKEKPPGWTFWIDRGGTFTDVIGRGPDGASRTVKLSSASGAYADAAVEAMRRVLGARPGDPFPAGRVDAVKMGTTVATNALLERTGAKTLLVTTAGFADALVIGDQTRPSLFASRYRQARGPCMRAWSKPTSGWPPTAAWCGPSTRAPWPGRWAAPGRRASRAPRSLSCTATSTPPTRPKPPVSLAGRVSASWPRAMRSPHCHGSFRARKPRWPTPI